MKYAAQTIPAQYRSCLRGLDRCALPRRALAQALVGPGFLVVLDELSQCVLEVAATKDQHVVEDLAPSGPNPSLGEGVRPRRSVGQMDDLHTLALEDLVEAGGELGVPIAEQEAGLDLTVLEEPCQLPALPDVYG